MQLYLFCSYLTSPQRRSRELYPTISLLLVKYKLGLAFCQTEVLEQIKQDNEELKEIFNNRAYDC